MQVSSMHVNAINQLMHVCDMTGHGPVTVHISMYNMQCIIIIIILYSNNKNYIILCIAPQL